MNEQANAKLEAALTALKANNGLLIDDHSCVNPWKPTHLVVLGWVDKEGKFGDRFEVCPITDKSLYCLNPLYVDKEGMAHLSTHSCGGSIDLRGTNLLSAAAKYNGPSLPFSRSKIIHIAEIRGPEFLVEHHRFTA